MISKRKKRAMEARGKVLMEGEQLKHAFTFTYLGYDFRAALGQTEKQNTQSKNE